MKTLLFFTLALAGIQYAMAWSTLVTTFTKNNPQPRTVGEAEKLGWKKLNDCTDKRFAGVRYVSPQPIPDMTLLYDVEGNVAGTQSILPEEEMLHGCDNLSYYVKDTVDGKTFCMSTMYFRDPATICSPRGMDGDKLALQNGPTFANVLSMPLTWDDAAANTAQWHKDRFFLGMGHHWTVNDLAKDHDCTADVAPLQVMYSSQNEGCTANGIVWSHFSTTPESTARAGWEKPAVVPVKMILRNPAPCILTLAGKKQVTTMHVWLESSASYCFF